MPTTGPLFFAQVAVGPKLAKLEGEWVAAIKKNWVLERHCLALEQECAAMRGSR